MSFILNILLCVICAIPLAAGTLDRPRYFEQRSTQSFETLAAGEAVTIHPDCIQLDGVTLHFVGSSGKARIEGLGVPAPATYLTRGLTRTFRQYPKVGIQHLYPGVDAVFYGRQGSLEYDLDFAPGTTSRRIRLDVEGALGLRLGEQGDLIVATRSGELRQLAPRVFQTIHSVRREIAAKYLLLSASRIGFELGKHDPAARLTIDPVIVYTKYYGGSDSDYGGPAATDAQGNVYVTGQTNSMDFPTTNGPGARPQPPLLALSNAGQTVVPLPVGAEVSVTAIAGTADAQVLYVATPNGIYISGNHGASFAKAVPLDPPGTVNAISVDAIDPSRALIATTTGLFVMNGAGQTAGRNEQGFAVGGNSLVNVSSVRISPADHAVSYAATALPDNFYASTDAGVTWHPLNPGYPGEPAPVQFSDTSIRFTLAPDGVGIYLIDGNAVLLKSNDAGKTWQQLGGQLYGAKSITIDPANPTTIYVVDNYGVQRSSDGGATFTTISPVLPGGTYVQSFAADGAGNLYFSTFNQIEVSADRGATWKILPARPVPHTLAGLGGQVFVGLDSPTVPFVVKWNPDGTKMLYATFFGGSYSDSITAIAIDPQGEAIVAGITASPDFPVTRTISAPSLAGSSSGFVAKLSADGTRAVYSTVIGASLGVNVNGLALDASGAPYIVGATRSPDFPTTAGAFQTKLPAGACQRTGATPFFPLPDSQGFAFAAKLTADASSLAYSTFLTGACGSAGQGVAVDAAGEAVVVGATASPDFPVSANAYQATFPGGIAGSLAFPNAFDFGFVTRLSAAGDRVIASSLIGGGIYSQANAVVLDAAGDAYITGTTWGITPGATPGAYQAKVANGCPPSINIGPGFAPPSGGSDAFVLKLDPAFTYAQYLTYVGGPCDDSGTGIGLAPNGNVWVSGRPSSGFPLASPFDESNANFVSEFSGDLSHLLFSSYSGGASIALDPFGAVYVSGTSNYPGAIHKNAGFGSGNTASLVRIDPSSSPPVIVNSIGLPNGVTSPNYGNSVAPGELIDIAGQNMGPANTVPAQLDATGRLPFQIGATSVSFDGYVAPLLSVQNGLIVCFAPFEISGSTTVTVEVAGQKSNSVRVAVASTSPYILSGVNQDGSLNSAAHPAPQGSVMTFYLTGLGLTSPLSQDGTVSMPPLPAPVTPVQAFIGQNNVQPQFVGAAYGAIAGITQVNVQVPVATYSSSSVGASIAGATAVIYIGQASPQ